MSKSHVLPHTFSKEQTPDILTLTVLVNYRVVNPQLSHLWCPIRIHALVQLSLPVLLRNLYFCDFPGGGGRVCTPWPPPPPHTHTHTHTHSGSAHGGFSAYAISDQNLMFWLIKTYLPQLGCVESVSLKIRTLDSTTYYTCCIFVRKYLQP